MFWYGLSGNGQNAELKSDGILSERVGGGGSSENEVLKRKEDTLDPSAGEGTGQE